MLERMEAQERRLFSPSLITFFLIHITHTLRLVNDLMNVDDDADLERMFKADTYHENITD